MTFAPAGRNWYGFANIRIRMAMAISNYRYPGILGEPNLRSDFQGWFHLHASDDVSRRLRATPSSAMLSTIPQLAASKGEFSPVFNYDFSARYGKNQINYN